MAYLQSGWGRADVSPRRRAVSVALTVAAHVLLFLLLWRLAPPLAPPEPERPLSTFQVAPDAPVASAPAPVARAAPRQQSGSAPPTPARPAEAVRPPVPVPPPPTSLPGVIPLDAFDLAQVPRRPGVGTGEGSENASGRDSGAVYGPGEGPGGQRLYNADWQRDPTDSELDPYFRGSPAPPGSWAEVACRTVPDNRVENCRTLGESPPGSGLARALREAAWQFRILPPRIGGKKLIGGWVRIHFDFVQGAARRR